MKITWILTMLAAAFVTAAPAHAAPPSNDHFANAQVVQTSTRTAGTTGEATVEAGEEVFRDESSGVAGITRSVWYSWTPTVSGPYVMSTCGADFDTALLVGTGSSVGSVTSVAMDSGGCLARGARLAIDAVAGTTYRIAVVGFNPAHGHDDEGAFDLVVEPLPITVSPSSVDFGSADVETFGPLRSVTITNGAADYTIHVPSAALTGENPEDFLQEDEGTCSREKPLGPGASCSVVLRFAPEAAGRRAAALSVRYAVDFPTSGPVPSVSPVFTATVPLSGTANVHDPSPGAQGASGATGPSGLPGTAGAAGPAGPLGSPGADGRIRCKVVRVRRIKTRISCSLKFPMAGARASLMRGRRVIARGRIRRGHVELVTRQPLPCGAYGLSFRRGGGVTRLPVALR